MAKAVRKRWRRLAGVACLLAVMYVSGYAYLSRRGMAEAERFESPYFFYCPLADVVLHQDLPPQHCWAVKVFDPLNRLDRKWFVGGTPCRGVTWGLRGAP